MAIVPPGSHVATEIADGAVTNASVSASAAIALSKLADPTTGKVVGSLASAAAAVYPPGFEFGYDEVTAGNVTVSSATEATGTAVISCAAHTFDGAAVLAHFFCGVCVPGTADSVLVSLFESATQISRLCLIQGVTAVSGVGSPLVGLLRFTPTAGSHTYTVTAKKATTNGTLFAGAGGTGAYPPMFIRFTKA